jgi:hypothetical protein
VKLDIIKYDLKSLEVTSGKIKKRNLELVANTYLKNLKNLNITSQIPILITSMLLVNAHQDKIAQLNILKQRILRPKEDAEKIRKEVWNNIQEDKTDKGVFLEQANNLLNQIKKHDKELSLGLNILSLNFIANSWAVYESTCKDLWKMLVNEYPTKLVQRILDTTKSEKNLPDSLIGKNISISFLAKYNFNISKNLGDILESKYDFTSNLGIYKAFKTILSDFKVDLNFLLSDYLNELEIARHVIVHRAGIIDEEYVRRSKRKHIKNGKHLVYTVSFAKKISQTSVLSVIKLIEIINKLF